MAPKQYKTKLTRPQVFLWRMSLFLILAVLLAIILDGQTAQLRRSFMANPGLNALIIGVLLVGIVYAFRQVLRLYPEINWVNNFRISDPGLAVDKQPVLLVPMATMLRDRTGHLSLATGSTRTLLDSVASRLEEQRETTRYLVGLLVFLGLLGTFWGLLQTVSSVGTTIGALDTTGGENVHAVRSVEGRAGRPAERHGHRLLRLAVRPLGLADPRLPRPAGGPRPKPLLQRARRLALQHHRAAIGRRGRQAWRRNCASRFSTCSARWPT